MVFGACCCANGGEDINIDERALIQELPPIESIEMPMPPQAVNKGGLLGPGSSFSVTVRRNTSEPIGLDIDLIDGFSAVVVDIKAGAIKTWNDQNRAHALRLNDRIVEVNGSKGDANNLVVRLKNDTTWVLTVQRPTEIPVSINRADAPSLGMDLRYAPNGTTLMITQVGEGPMHEWNKKNPATAVRRFDRIIQLNKVRGTPTELLQASEDVENLDLIVVHYPPLP